jgi:histidine triad (HIT) family protein
MSQEQDCIFCKIARGEIPGEKIYEDDEFFVVLDINPYVLGHCLVIPKEHVQWVWDLPNYDKFMETIKKIAKVLQKAFNIELVQGGIAGVDVDHAHFHLFPRTDEGNGGFPTKPLDPKPSEKEMQEVFEKIKGALWLCSSVFRALLS